MVSGIVIGSAVGSEAVADAARSQLSGGELVVTAPHLEPAPALRDAVAQAVRTADWVWVLDGHAVPEAGALQALLDARTPGEGLPTPEVLASKVVRPDGALHPLALVWPEIFEKEVSVAACAHGLASLRAARPGSLLVSSTAVERHGLPRADFVADGETLEWTARILRHEVGYMVPSSVAVRSDDERPHVARDLRNRVRMLRGDTWRFEEKLWFGLLLAQDAARAATGRA